nr:COP9 signalosome complex subunit 5 [Rachicladosporium sp. CCFEE 5018]
MDALKSWEIENAVKLTDPNRDALYGYDSAEQKKINAAKPWKRDPHHFKHVRISAVALIKMVMHARSGGSLEVMGLMLGYVQHETFVVTDALRLPVEGTETRVNAQTEADEYMVSFLERSRQAGQLENAVGWYHSHPGYGCWLSGIDVATEHTQQSFSDPFLAVVIDPDRTISAGKVEIGAFRTYPEGYVPPGSDSAAAGMAAVPLAKAEDFGAHANRYYSLEVSHYKSTLDNKLLEALWNKYWVQTLSASPLFSNREYGTRQIQDLAGKIKQVTETKKHRSTIDPMMISKRNGGDEAMAKVVTAAERIANEERMGLMAAIVKEKLFGGGAAALEEVATAGEANGQDAQMTDVKAA